MREVKIDEAAKQITIGPYFDIEPLQTSAFEIHFECGKCPPLLAVQKLTRTILLSQLSSSAHIKESFDIVNHGPEPKSPYSRLEMLKAFHATASEPSKNLNVYSSIQMTLPQGSSKTVCKDEVGIVTTCKYLSENVLQVNSRYPILGGWQSGFSLEYSSPLSNYCTSSGGANAVIKCKVSIMNLFGDISVNNLDVKLLLPEGALYVTVC